MTHAAPLLSLSRSAPLAEARPGPLAWLLAVMALRRSRLSLATLDDHLLRDVGLSREEALRESRRPAWEDGRARHWEPARRRAWDVPAYWLR